MAKKRKANKNDYFNLEIALLVGNLTFIKIITKKDIDLSAPLESKVTPLQVAILGEYSEGRKLQIIKFLIDNGADVNVLSTIKNISSLILAARRGEKNIVDLLIKEGADITHQDDDGMTALLYSVLNNKEDIVDSLTDAGDLSKDPAFLFCLVWAALQDDADLKEKLILSSEVDVLTFMAMEKITEYTQEHGLSVENFIHRKISISEDGEKTAEIDYAKTISSIGSLLAAASFSLIIERFADEDAKQYGYDTDNNIVILEDSHQGHNATYDEL